MAARKIEISNATLGLATMMMMIASRTVAQSNGCSSVMMRLSPCLDYIGSKSPDPGLTCCTTIADVVQSDPRCLCMVLDGSAASFGITINHTRALELPGICKVQAPPISHCTGIPDSPAVAPPSEPPEPSEEDTEEAADALTGSTGSNTKSSSRNSKKAASLIATMLIPACALLCIF